MRGLRSDEDPDYGCWQCVFNDLLAPYVQADESFDFASAREFEDMDDDLVDDPNAWPNFDSSNSAGDDDEEDCESFLHV